MANTARALGRLFAVAALAAYGTSSFAAGCKFWDEIKFVDGTKGCLTDYSIAQMRPHLFIGSLEKILPSNGFSVIAVTSKDSMCPVVVGLGSIPKSNYNQPNDSAKAAATSYAIRNCRASLAGKTKSTGGPCGCEVAITDGSSPLTKAAFEALVSPSKDSPNIDAGPAPAAAPALSPVPQQAAGPAAARIDAIYQESPSAAPTQQPAKTSGGVQPGAVAAKDSGGTRPTARALVIGNSNYARFGKLNNPKSDATAIADKLRALGVGVDLLLDANRSTLVNALNSFQNNARGKDVNLLYYAGHSAQVNGINYLIPTDMQMESVAPSYVKMNAIALTDVFDYMPAKSKVVLMEACRENSVSKSVGSAGLAPISASTGAFVVYANRDCSSVEEKAKNSTFTAALLQNIDAPQDIGVVLRKVRQAVLTQTNSKQEPWDSGILTDELILSRLSR